MCREKYLKYLSFKLDNLYPPRGISQDDHLIRHNVKSLNERRKICSAMLVQSLLCGTIDCSHKLAKAASVPRQSSRHTKAFHVMAHRTNLMARANMMQCQ